MTLPTFKNITVQQYQQLYAIGKADSQDKDMQLVSCLTGLTLTQVEEMRLDDFNSVCRLISSLFTALPDQKPRRWVQVSGRSYRVIYNPRQLSPGKYVEIQTWLKGGVIENMDKIMASLLEPAWWNRHKATHPQLCEGVKDLKFIAVYSTCVFFCRLWTNSIKALGDFLDKESKAKSLMTEADRRRMKKVLQTASDGFST